MTQHPGARAFLASSSVALLLALGASGCGRYGPPVRPPASEQRAAEPEVDQEDERKGATSERER